MSLKILMTLGTLIPSLLFCSEQVRIVVLLGKPGAGKGTVGANLERQYGLKRISSGEFLLAHIDNQTELGKQVEPYILRGDMPPDEMVVDAFFEYFRSLDFAQGCILDGFPRTVHQAELLDEKVGQIATLTIVHLDVSDQCVLGRIDQRLMCRQCMHPYHPVFSSPEQPNLCDVCGGSLYHRSDDAPESIAQRLLVYQARTLPVVEYYRKEGRLISIAAEQAIDAVYRDVLQEIGF